MKITIGALRAACAANVFAAASSNEDQVDLFERVFPDGVEPTAEALRTALDAGLDVFWCVNLLLPEARKRFYAETDVAAAMFYAQMKPLWMAYRNGAVAERQYAKDRQRITAQFTAAAAPVLLRALQES